MKIQAINNTNFKGLFTDASGINGGNWRMEYSPYSWESNNTGKMANQTDIDVYAKNLPDNDKIYTYDLSTRRKSARDILGTEFYFENADGKMRRTITEVPEMNREDSLRVLDKKLGIFLEDKQKLRAELEGTVAPKSKAFFEESSGYDKLSSEFNRGYFDRRDRSFLKTKMDGFKAGMVMHAHDTLENFEKYIKLIGSMDAVRDARKKGQDEVALIGKLREAGNLIDISRRSIFNPNEALIAAFDNIRTLSEKVVCLPDRPVPMETILAKLGNKNHSVEDVIKIVEKMIARKVI